MQMLFMDTIPKAPRSRLLEQGGSDQGYHRFWSKYSSFELVFVRNLSALLAKHPCLFQETHFRKENPVKCSQISWDKEKYCKIPKMTGCCFEKTIPGYQPPH